MASKATKRSNSLSKTETGFVDHEDIFPIIYSAPVTPLQESLLNSPFHFKFEDADDGGLEGGLEEAIDPELLPHSLIHPSLAPNFNCPFPMEVEPALVLGSNFEKLGTNSTNSAITQDHHELLVEVPEHSMLPMESGQFQLDAPSSFRIGNTNASKHQNTPPKVNFVDPMHPSAHLKHTAVFCCQIPTCVKECHKDLTFATRQFILHFSRPTIAEPLYGGRAAKVLPQTQNPDVRIPMLLLSGARVYKAEKLGEDPEVRLFVGDIINRKKKYWEVLPGGSVEQLGWIDDLRNTVAEADRISTWECNTHGNTWNVSVLDHLFDNGSDSTDATTPTDYDSGYASSTNRRRAVSRMGGATSGYASSSGQMGASSRKGRSTHGDNNTALHMTPMEPTSFSVANDNRRDFPVRNRNHAGKKLNGNLNPLKEVEEQEFEEFDFDLIGDVGELLNTSDHAGVDELIQPQDFMWTDRLLEEVNSVFLADESNSDDTTANNFEPL